MNPRSEPVDDADRHPHGTHPEHPDAFQLAESEAVSIHEFNHKSPSGQVPLPLPRQDREALENNLQKRQKRIRIAIMEVMLSVTFFCAVLALTSWFTLRVLILGLGCNAVLCLLGV